jgi:glycosyltransferase involved in cell wall biosynthesis
MMTCVACPWSGTYGFRSRLVEVMSLGVPTVASREAVWGMELDTSGGILLADGDAALARLVVDVVTDAPRARELGDRGRRTVETLFTVDATYGRWMRAVREWLETRGESGR